MSLNLILQTVLSQLLGNPTAAARIAAAVLTIHGMKY